MSRNFILSLLLGSVLFSCKPMRTKEEINTDELVQITKDSLASESNTLSTNTIAITEEEDTLVWLKGIFKNGNSNQFFPNYNVEHALCTKRYQEFIDESGQLYGPSNLTDEEIVQAEAKYKTKWAKTYPLEAREMWLFGRGNGDVGELKQLNISKANNLFYDVFIDYGQGIKTYNKVTVVLEEGQYKIDYCKTEFIEYKKKMKKEECDYSEVILKMKQREEIHYADKFTYALPQWAMLSAKPEIIDILHIYGDQGVSIAKQKVEFAVDFKNTSSIKTYVSFLMNQMNTALDIVGHVYFYNKNIFACKDINYPKPLTEWEEGELKKTNLGDGSIDSSILITDKEGNVVESLNDLLK